MHKTALSAVYKRLYLETTLYLEPAGQDDKAYDDAIKRLHHLRKSAREKAINMAGLYLGTR